MTRNAQTHFAEPPSSTGRCAGGRCPGTIILGLQAGHLKRSIPSTKPPANPVSSLRVSGEFINQLHYGDNLVRLRGEGVDKPIPDEIADLIYLDPPFNSARNYTCSSSSTKAKIPPRRS